MAKDLKKPITTKKHLARLERERRQTRIIVITSVVVLVSVILLLVAGTFNQYGYKVLDKTFLPSLVAVASVNGDNIKTSDWEAQTRYARYSTIRNAQQLVQLAQIFGSDPSTGSSFVQQLQQTVSQLTPETMGQQVMDQLVNDVLIRQEATRRGITISPAEVDKAFQSAFGYYPDGTPTPTATVPPISTSTLSPLQMTLVPPSPTPTATPTLTVTATVAGTTALTGTPLPAGTGTLQPELTGTPGPSQTPTATEVLTPTLTPTEAPTPTPYTQQGFENLKATTIAQFTKDDQVSEGDLRFLIESSLYRQKVMEAVLKDEGVSQMEEQVWARHILVADEQTANEVLAKVKEPNADWYVLANKYSTDTGSKDSGGDLGWFGKGKMIAEFEQAAFGLQVGEISQPVKTQYGYHIIQVLGHENRPISDQDYQTLQQQKFQDWLTSQKDKAKVVIHDWWKKVVPDQPALPADVLNAVNQMLQQQQQQQIPGLTVPTTTP
jgi:peptidyl-prolyl cis-trans isomerase D